jgi:hypothetical protein
VTLVVTAAFYLWMMQRMLFGLPRGIPTEAHDLGPTEAAGMALLVGLTLAKEITGRTSLNVVVLERGQPRKTSDYAATMDELDHALRYRMMQNLAEETATHRHSLKANAVPIRPIRIVQSRRWHRRRGRALGRDLLPLLSGTFHARHVDA